MSQSLDIQSLVTYMTELTKASTELVNKLNAKLKDTISENSLTSLNEDINNYEENRKVLEESWNSLTAKKKLFEIRAGPQNQDNDEELSRIKAEMVQHQKIIQQLMKKYQELARSKEDDGIPSKVIYLNFEESCIHVNIANRVPVRLKVKKLDVDKKKTLSKVKLSMNHQDELRRAFGREESCFSLKSIKSVMIPRVCLGEDSSGLRKEEKHHTGDAGDKSVEELFEQVLEDLEEISRGAKPMEMGEEVEGCTCATCMRLIQELKDRMKNAERELGVLKKLCEGRVEGDGFVVERVLTGSQEGLHGDKSIKIIINFAK